MCDYSLTTESLNSADYKLMRLVFKQMMELQIVQTQIKLLFKSSLIWV